MLAEYRSEVVRPISCFAILPQGMAKYIDYMRESVILENHNHHIASLASIESFVVHFGVYIIREPTHDQCSRNTSTHDQETSRNCDTCCDATPLNCFELQENVASYRSTIASKDSRE